LNGSIFHSVDGNVGSNILYHNKVDGTSNEHMSKGKNHLSQLHAAPGFGRVYDETTQLHQTNSSYQVADDIDLDMEFSAENVKGNHPRATTVAHLGNFTFGEQTFDSDLNLQNGGSKKDSHSGEMFITVSDINLRSMPSQVPPPSRPPPVVDAKKDMCGLHSNSRVVASEETSGAVSPPFFDAEDHMNSSVTASADAMNEAMLIAEEKLRSTKELKGRKKWNCETYLKSNYDAKVNEAKMCKDITRLSSLNDETAVGSYDWRHSKAKLYATDDRQELKKASPETTDNLEGKRAVNMFEEKNKMESRSSIESDRSTEVGTWKDESEFFELVGMEESEMVTQTAKQSKNLMQGIGAQKHGQKEREASNVQEKHKQVKATEENFQVEEYEKKYKATKEAREHDENIMKPEASNGKQRQREHIEREKMAKVFEEEENEKSIKIAHQHGKSEKKVTEADQSAIMEDVCEMGNREHKQAEIQKSIEVDRQTANDIQQATGLRENQKKLREVEKQQQNVNRNKHSEKMEENRKPQSEAFAIGQTDQEEKLKGSGKLEDIVERSNAAVESDYTEETEVCKSENQMKLKLGKRIQMNKGLKEARERVEIEKSLKSSFENEESDGGVLPAFRWDENGKKLKEDIELEVKEIRLKEASEQRENKAYEKDQSTKKFEDFYDGDGEGNILPKSGDGKWIQKVMNQTPVQEQINRMLSEDQKKKVTESTSSQTFASEGNVAVSNENRHLEQSENMNKDGEMEKCKGLNKDLDDKERKDGGKMKNAEVTDETWEIESGEDLSTQSASMHEAFIRKPKVSKDYVAKMRTECKVGEKQLKGVGMENQLDNEKFSAPEQMTAGDAEHSKTQSEKEEDTVTKVDCRRSTEAAEPIVQETVNAQKTAQLFHIGQSTESKTKSINEKSAIIKDTERMKRERESEKDHLRKMEEEVDREREREKEVEKAVLEAEREREREKDRMAVDRATFEARDRAYAEACEREERAAFERATMEARYKALAEARERLEKACAEARDKSYIDKETTEARLKAERAAVERATAEAQDRALEKLKSERTAFESRERLERSVSDNFCGRQDSSSSVSICLNLLLINCEIVQYISNELNNRICWIHSFRTLAPQRFPDIHILFMVVCKIERPCNALVCSLVQYFTTSSCYIILAKYLDFFEAASFSERSEREGESPQRCRARLERHRRTAERAVRSSIF